MVDLAHDLPSEAILNEGEHVGKASIAELGVNRDHSDILCLFTLYDFIVSEFWL